MFDKERFTKFHQSHKKSFREMIDNALLSSTFNEIYYRKRIDGKKKWIEDKLFGDIIGWIWSWMNSINTNYTCIYFIIDYLNTIIVEKITMDDLLDKGKKESTLKRIENLIYEHRETIFKPGSEVFKKMFFVTQRTWNRGNISVISTILTLGEKFELLDVDLNFERGNEDDMSKGTDMFLVISGIRKRNQHKSCYLKKVGSKYISDKFYWDEKIYRNNLDTITIEYKEKIYFVSISQDSTLIGLDQNNEFFFHESLLIGEPIDVVQCEFTNSLTLLLGQCISKNIIFKFHKDDSGINHIFHENGRLIVYLNNLERSELDKTKILITNKIKELQ